MSLTPETFDSNARDALEDRTLRSALRQATSLFGERRSGAIAEVPNWEELRSHARAIKDDVLANLDRYLEEFTERAAAVGAQIHWARDADEANSVIVEILRDANASTVVKSKSMTTEEIHLNTALEAAGITADETDLGEWIVQLAEETPSHIIVPAIHKTKEQIAELLEEKIGMPATDDPKEMTAAARVVLRDRFAKADAGISGVNFAIAETGSILILENEGNARFTTSLPRLHIAVMGIEKILPRFADLEVFLRLLPRSGTGQHLTSYQSVITGVKTGGGGEGPEEFHIVLLDNGRSKMLELPITRQSLACIRCGACLNACPVYQVVGGHAYGSVYPGPIGAVITPQLQTLRQASKLPFASSLCGACLEVCPVKIDIPSLLLHLRGQIASGREGVPPHRRERFVMRVWAWFMSGPRRYRMAMRVARVMQRLFISSGKPNFLGRALGPLAGPLLAWTKERDLRPLARGSFRQWWGRSQ